MEQNRENDEVLVRHAWPHPLGGKSREAFERELCCRLQGRVHEAYLFGSAATGEMSVRSDVDLLLVQDTTRPFVERFKDYLDVVKLVPRMDLLVYTPEEFAHIRARPAARTALPG